MRIRPSILPVVMGAALLMAQTAAEVTASPSFPSAVYRCVVEEVVTFSDRPCDEQAKQYAPASEWVNTVQVEKSSPSGPRTVSKPSRPVPSRSIAQAQKKHKEECARLEEALREVRSQLRAGYNVKQGERLKDRNRKLNADLRSKRC